MAAARAEAPNPSFYLVNRSDQAINQVPMSAPSQGRRLGAGPIGRRYDRRRRQCTDPAACGRHLRVRPAGRLRGRAQRGTPRASTPAPSTTSASARRGRPQRPASGADAARDPSFRLVNRGKREIEEVYVRLAGSTDVGTGPARRRYGRRRWRPRCITLAAGAVPLGRPLRVQRRQEPGEAPAQPVRHVSDLRVP